MRNTNRFLPRTVNVLRESPEGGLWRWPESRRVARHRRGRAVVNPVELQVLPLSDEASPGANRDAHSLRSSGRTPGRSGWNDLLLVGGSSGMVVHGRDSTVPVTMVEIVLMTQWVSRGGDVRS